MIKNSLRGVCRFQAPWYTGAHEMFAFRNVRVLVVVLGLLLAACGGGVASQEPTADATSEPPGDTATEAAAGDEGGDPLIVGTSLSLTGSYERTGKDMQNGYQLWVDHVNAEGGILGRPVELRVLDDQSDPATASRLYEKLINEDQVDLLLGPYSTPVTLAASTVTEEAGFPMLAAGASGSEIWSRGYENIFGLYTLANTYSHGTLGLAEAAGYRTVAIVHEDTAFTIDAADGAQQRAEELGMEVVFREAYPKEQTDFSTIMAGVANSGAEVFIGGTYLPASVSMVRQAQDAGYQPKVMFFTVGPALPEFPDTLGDLANLVMGDSQWEPVIDAPGLDEFVSAYSDAHGVEPGYHAAGAYAAGQILQAVAEEAGGTDREALREAFGTLELETVFGPWKADETGRNAGKPTLVIQFIDGERQVVWPEDLANASPVLEFAYGG